jgi:membrane protein DedA with SNARE-associated domain
MEQTLLLLQQYGYYILFPFAVFEGPIIGVIAGFLAAAGKMNVLGVFLVLIAGDMVGDVMYYGLGRWGGRTIVVRYGRYIGITPAKMQAAERYQDSKSFTALLLFGKTQPTGSIILVAAGPWSRNCACCSNRCR